MLSALLLAITILPGISSAKDARAKGYLKKSELPSSLAQLPPPLAPGSAAEALDLDIARRSFTLRDTPRWAQAISDADLSFPRAAQTYACALGTRIPQADVPHLHELLQRSRRDLSGATKRAKEHYQRKRPLNRPRFTRHFEALSWQPSGGVYE
ncbi:MAG: hypothetical protein CGU28_13365 [Candidatus Dactylopiibacterium carminicum]|nr:MAG: hypothetical protein CGU28_13365 [Candidatus Dactylopiibacterium carminicum]